MTSHAILLPVFVQIALTFGLGFWTTFLRYRATATREVRVKDIALGQPAWPAYTTKIGNCFRNQFEGPILFYAVIALLLASNMVDMVQIVLAWTYIAARLVHAFIHTGSNFLPRRFLAYIAGMLTLLAMWIWFAVQVIGSL
jgi:hypothetical protein